MKHTWKKTAAFVLAMALVVGAAPANAGAGGLFGGTAIVASAAEESVTLQSGTTSSGPISTNLTDMLNNLFVGSTAATISASDDKVITKLVITKGSLYDTFNASGLSVSPGTMSFNSNVLTVTDINSSTVTLSRLTDFNVSISSIVVYYDDAATTDISTAAVNLASDNSVASLTIGNDTITDLSDFDITYGTDDSHTATAVPTDAGTYYAYVTPKKHQHSLHRHG